MREKTINITVKISVILIFVLFFTINSFFILKKELWIDEVITYKIVSNLSIRQIASGVDVHPFGYYLLMKLLPHTSIYQLRFYSLIIMYFALYSLFIIVKNMYNIKIAFIILLFSSLSATISEYSSQARMYSLLFLFSVLILYYFFTKRYIITLLVVIMSIFTHYYAVFLLIPFTISLYLKEEPEIFRKIMKITMISLVITFAILSLIIYNQFFSNNNPYKITPPIDWSSIHSLPSTIIFQFIIPSSVLSKFLLIYSFIIIFLIIFLLVTFEYDINIETTFLLYSYLTVFFIFSLGFFHQPFHHRYTIMFFPMTYLLLILSTEQKTRLIRNIIYSLLIVFLAINFISYHLHPDNQFIELSKTIECKKNILHETPFSYLPMSVYLPECNHYFAKSSDWKDITYETLYTTPDRINNFNISYDIYIHYFEDLKMPELLKNSNLTTIKLILIKN